jgi:hypothetical protein
LTAVHYCSTILQIITGSELLATGGEMAIELSVPNPRFLSDNVWETEIAPDDLTVLGVPAGHRGEVSVILLPDLICPDPDAELLRFRPSSAQLLNRGESARTIIIFGIATPEDSIVAPDLGPLVQNDDERFVKELQQLPSPIAKCGRDLLSRIREEFEGYFRISKSGKYVNRPNNFWTAKVQPRDGSLAITVRGNPGDFERMDELDIRPDRRGYSRFKVQRPDQMEHAWRTLRKSALG